MCLTDSLCRQQFIHRRRYNFNKSLQLAVVFQEIDTTQNSPYVILEISFRSADQCFLVYLGYMLMSFSKNSKMLNYPFKD